MTISSLGTLLCLAAMLMKRGELNWRKSPKQIQNGIDRELREHCSEEGPSFKIMG